PVMLASRHASMTGPSSFTAAPRTADLSEPGRSVAGIGSRTASPPLRDANAHETTGRRVVGRVVGHGESRQPGNAAGRRAVEDILCRNRELDAGQKPGRSRSVPECRVERRPGSRLSAMQDVLQSVLVVGKQGCGESAAMPDGTGARMEPGWVVQCTSQIERSLEV